ncbi:unnamed protein product, partial [Lota lota]
MRSRKEGMTSRDAQIQQSSMRVGVRAHARGTRRRETKSGGDASERSTDDLETLEKVDEHLHGGLYYQRYPALC